MSLENLRVVLVEPSASGNLGAVARAMSNMGARELIQVGGIARFDDPEAQKFATHGAEILANTQQIEHLELALEGCSIIIGSTARDREKAPNLVRPQDLAALWALQGAGTKGALVLGTERTGLSNQAMSLCTHLVTIPTPGPQSSLNLAQAALLLLWELSQETETPQRPDAEPAQSEAVEAMKGHLFEILDQIGYVKAQDQKSLWLGFSALVARARLSKREVSMLRGIFNRIQVRLGVKPPRKR
ncbi:MAG: hypothetical protein A2508_01155 [Candidatus Lambdaproteobacteria bacterium RIFOXYD12_FULL_49_8]|uniref:tRNA (cytidine/uridine-2'-O-)-methyltransferase TrmJ n=1 Tax=Candidatus Lambdaproteobacteria bacterium RIFOXYD2_FULL_50_16 TaxID=1817772 RepID=A0A1F6GD78_9PROT|nr:MAG: hypothetical protein A2527_12140 [Candidatus Lambdaproteobacteria bacterium RIFOXYD2_FULL_50_16]OGG97225.1 MAG: hypothetical protein A2508_01155 [Candidatus Lambdaproteobacteria bacterium RIFOXYD12_FULL_49_8]